MRKLLPLLLVSFLFSCTQPGKQNTSQYPAPQPTVYSTPAGDKIIFLEDYYKVYLAAIKTNYDNRYSIYEANVQDSIFNEYFSKSEYSQLIKSTLSIPVLDTLGLRGFISEVTNNRTKIEDIISSALAKCNKEVKNDSITIYILPSNNNIKNVMEGKGGVSALTAGSKQILLTLDPGISKWTEMLPYNVAREFDYSYWTKMDFKNAPQRTLLDYLVLEGRADSYAHLIYPDVDCPWTKVLPADVESQIWNRIKGQLNNTDVAFQYDVMYGSKSQYPLWGGFALGYHIVQSSLKNHPELSPTEWINLPSAKILEMSDYVVR